MDLARALGWLTNKQYITSPRAKPAALIQWHNPEYIEALQQAEAEQSVSQAVRRQFNIGTVSNPVFAEVFRRPATAAGGSILAGELLARSGIVYNPAGGTHHGLPARANGFCYLNDPVLAMLSMRRNGVQRIAYIDIDAHHPDGVEVGFAGDANCLMISVHEENLWPKTGGLHDNAGGSAFNLPVPCGFNDTEMAYVREELILPKVASFQPEAIVLQCGADGVLDDPLSHLSLSNNAHWDIVRALRPLSSRFLVLGGGGYNPWTVGRLWTGVWGILNGYEPPTDLPAAAQEVLRQVTFRKSRQGKNPKEKWWKTLRDDGENGPLRTEIRERIEVLQSRKHLGQ